jgi:hypothetical protein
MKTTTIETGSIVQFVYGAGCGEEYGILVEINETEWGPQYKFITDSGEVHYSSEIRKMGQRTANGSPIGCFLVE